MSETQSTSDHDETSAVADPCPQCGLGAYVIDSWIGRVCRFCGHSCPYGDVH
jgi:hypothetical protein